MVHLAVQRRVAFCVPGRRPRCLRRDFQQVLDLVAQAVKFHCARAEKHLTELTVRPKKSGTQ